MKKIIVLFLSVTVFLLCLLGCSDNYVSAEIKQTEKPVDTEKADKEPIVINWEENLTPEVAEDIKNAFREIGEKPEYIVSVEHVKDKETALFVRRDYKVTFDKGDLIDLFDEDNRKWNHAVEWRITTEEWNEGEPEREQYPREYLVTIRFWTDDDTTNILQWSHTGNGELQEE